MDLELWWVLPARREVAVAASVLQALSLVPEARPRLIGVVEPERTPLLPDDDAPFLDLWRDELARGGSYSWKASRPFRGGCVMFPYRGEEPWEELRGYEKTVSLYLWVRPAGFADPERREVLIGFFTATADQLGAIYASAGLELQEQPEADLPLHLANPSLVHGVWVGIPPVRTWLQWFGGAYVSALAKVPAVVKARRGMLLRRGEGPAMRGELPGPPLPPELCWRARTGNEDRAERARALLATAPGDVPPPPLVSTRVPAVFLPDIGASLL